MVTVTWQRSNCSERPADRLDPERASRDDIVAVGVDERRHLLCWRSSSAPKKDAARLRIFVRPLELSILLLQLPDTLSLRRAHSRLGAAVDISLTDPCTHRLEAKPQLRRTRDAAPYSVPNSARSARTIRTAPPSPPTNTDASSVFLAPVHSA